MTGRAPVPGNPKGIYIEYTAGSFEELMAKKRSVLQRDQQRQQGQLTKVRKQSKELPVSTAPHKPDTKQSKRVPAAGQQHPAARPWTCSSTVSQQAAGVLKKLLAADARGAGGASIKALALAPHIQAKKATYAVVVETLKHLAVLKHVVAATASLAQHSQLESEIKYVLLYDLLFGQGIKPKGPAERALLAIQDDLEAQLLLSQTAVLSTGTSQPADAQGSDDTWPRSVRVNTLKLSVLDALSWLRSHPSASRASKAEVSWRSSNTASITSSCR